MKSLKKFTFLLILSLIAMESIVAARMIFVNSESAVRNIPLYRFVRSGSPDMSHNVINQPCESKSCDPGYNMSDNCVCQEVRHAPVRNDDDD